MAVQNRLNLATDLPIWRSIDNERQISPGRWELDLNADYMRATGINAVHVRNFLAVVQVDPEGEDDPEATTITIRIPTDRTPSEYVDEMYVATRPEFQPRKLTLEEIVYVLNSVPFVMSSDASNLPTRQVTWQVTPDDIDPVLRTINPEIIRNYQTTADTIRYSILRRLTAQLLDTVLSPLALDDLKNAIVNQFEKSRIHPGSMVGVTAAEALGGPITQMALNSFHSSGSAKNVSYGIDAMRELLNVSQKRKHESSTIYFKRHDLSFDDVIVKKNEIIEVTVADLIEDYNIGSPLESNLSVNWWHDIYQIATGRTAQSILHKELDQVSTVLRLYLNINAVYANRITMDQIVLAIDSRNAGTVYCVPSPLAIGIIDVYPNEEKIREPLQKDKRGLVAESQSPIFASDFAPFTFLNTIVYPNLGKISIKGIPGIQRLFPADTGVWKVISEEKKMADDERQLWQQARLEQGITDPPVDPNRAIWYLIFNTSMMKANGVTPQKVMDLLTACYVTILEGTTSYLLVQLPTRPEIEPLDKERQAEFPKDVQEKILEKEPELKETDPRKREAEIKLREDLKKKEAEDLLKPSGWVNHRLALDAKEKKLLEDYHRRAGNNFYIRPVTPIERAANLYYAETDGANLQALLSRDDVDETRTLCNNVHEIYRVLGIEAARTFLIREFLAVIGNEGGNINPRHVTLLVDFMTNMGEPTPITFSGISRQPIGALEKASFERAMDTFQEAAGFGKSETIKSVSAAVVIGQRAKIGTGYMDILVDEEMEAALVQEMQGRQAALEQSVLDTEENKAILDVDTNFATGTVRKEEDDPEMMNEIVAGVGELIPQFEPDVNLATADAPQAPQVKETVTTTLPAIAGSVQRPGGIPSFKQVKEELSPAPSPKQIAVPVLRPGTAAPQIRIPLKPAPAPATQPTPPRAPTVPLPSPKGGQAPVPKVPMPTIAAPKLPTTPSPKAAPKLPLPTLQKPPAVMPIPTIQKPPVVMPIPTIQKPPAVMAIPTIQKPPAVMPIATVVGPTPKLPITIPILKPKPAGR